MVSIVTSAQWISLAEFIDRFMQGGHEPEVVASVPEGVSERCVWTLVDDGECASLCNGRAVVNFMGYVITDRPWEEDDMISVDWDDDDRLLTFGGAYDQPYLFCAHDGILRKRNDPSAQEHHIIHDADTTEEGEGLIDMSGKYVLAVGEHLAVPDYLGPFADAEDASRYAEINHGADAWSVVHISPQENAPQPAEITSTDAKLGRFVENVSKLVIWDFDDDTGQPRAESAGQTPPEEYGEAHDCLMNLIREARKLMATGAVQATPEPSNEQVRRFLSLSIENGGLGLEDIAEFMQVIGQMTPEHFNEMLVAHGVLTSNDALLSYKDTLRILGRD